MRRQRKARMIKKGLTSGKTVGGGNVIACADRVLRFDRRPAGRSMVPGAALRFLCCPSRDVAQKIAEKVLAGVPVFRHELRAFV